MKRGASPDANDNDAVAESPDAHGNDAGIEKSMTEHHAPSLAQVGDTAAGQESDSGAPDPPPPPVLPRDILDVSSIEWDPEGLRQHLSLGTHRHHELLTTVISKKLAAKGACLFSY